MRPNSIEAILDRYYQRGISSRAQLLNEMLRVKLTERAVREYHGNEDDEDLPYDVMRQTTEPKLGFFPADRDFFGEMYRLFKEADPAAFTLEIFKNDRSGPYFAPLHITEYMTQIARASVPSPKDARVLITEAEGHLAGLQGILNEFPEAQITLTTQHYPMKILLELVYGDHPRVSIINESIYADCLPDQYFDFIYCMPAFNNRVDPLGRVFLTRETEGIALENLSGHLKHGGSLAMLMPAKVTFSGGGFAELRRRTAQDFAIRSLYLMPEGALRPYTAIRTYMLVVSATQTPIVEIGSLAINQNAIVIEQKRDIPTSEFLAHEDWRIELMLAQDDEAIRKLKESRYPKAKLKEVAEVFRGKSILKKDTAPGGIDILNISNIQDGEIDSRDMDTLDEDIRKNQRYLLEEGDVLLSCRGTAIKAAVFRAQERPVIASANLIVIRAKQRVLGGFIKLFLESPTGQAMTSSFQRGTTILNFNFSDVMEMEIPLPPMEVQQQLVSRYKDEQQVYQKTITEAQRRWDDTKSTIYDQMI